MLLTLLYILGSTAGILSSGGDWYRNIKDYSKINSCYYFPAGTNSVFDFYCGMTTDEFLTYRANNQQESVVIYTMDNIKSIVALSYAFIVISTLMQLFIPSYHKLNIFLVSLEMSFSVSSIFYIIHGFSLLLDVDIKKNSFNLQYGFYAQCTLVVLSIIIIFLKMKEYLVYINSKK